MKYGRLRSISARQSGSTWPSLACSSVIPQRRSTSVKVTKRLAHVRRSSGKTSLTNRSRSRIMSRKVEEMKTRI